MQNKRSFISNISKVVTFAIGLLLFLWSIKISYEKQQIRLSLDIQKQLNYFISKINEELNTSAEVLFSLSNLINTFEKLTSDEFRKFTSDLSVRKKGILLIEWQPRVLESERILFVDKIRRAGIKNFEMLEPDENNSLIKAKKRPEHFPVLYSVSTRDEENSIGLDLSWSPERMESKYKARDIGKLRASSTFNVMLTEGSQNLLSGFAISLPVYKTQKIPETVKERREELRGFLAAVVYLDELLHPLAQELGSKQLNVQITELATNSFIQKNILGDVSRFSKQKVIDVFGQKWEVVVSPTSEYLSSYFSSGHLFIPIGLLVFILLLIFSLKRNEKINRELRETRNHLQGALNDARVAAKSKMIFLANMSHEIRTPMNAILGYGRLIKGERDERVRDRYIDRMTSSGNHLLNIIDDILEVSSLEESKVQLHPHKFNLHELVAEVNDVFLEKRDATNIEYVFNVDSSLSHLYGDSNRLRQILLNLLSNSLKFTDNGRIVLSCSKKDVDEEGNVLVEFMVQDTGVGMDESYLPCAYHPFSQEDQSFSRKKGGVGLGLSIVYSLVKLMSGEIEVTTSKGVGTTFTISLPFMLAAQVDKTIEGCHHQTNNIALCNKNILVAEDDQDARFLIETFLDEENLELDFVNNGKELLAQSSKKSYDLILTDIQMPELDGLSATRELRSQGVSTPILALSAHALREEKEKAILAGVNDILSKPFNKESLVSFVLSHLD